MSRGQIARAALLLMVGNAASRLLGLGREAVVVGLFGLSASTSAFVTAATVPTVSGANRMPGYGVDVNMAMAHPSTTTKTAKMKATTVQARLTVPPFADQSVRMVGPTASPATAAAHTSLGS